MRPRDGFVSWVLSAITPDGSAVTTLTRPLKRPAGSHGPWWSRGPAGEEEPLGRGDEPGPRLARYLTEPDRPRRQAEKSGRSSWAQILAIRQTLFAL